MSSIPIAAEIYYVKPSSDPYICFAKISFYDCMYINSISVQPDKFKQDKLFVSMPHWFNNNKKEYVEMPNKSTNPLTRAVQQACLEAYHNYERLRQTGKPTRAIVHVKASVLEQFTPTNTRLDVVVEDVSDEPINLNGIPF